jgi:hypothetical protein
VNEHVGGIAAELRKIGHSVTVLGSSNRAKELAAGRRALLDGLDAEVVALGPAVPISRRSRIGVPVGARANLELALALGRFDVVHGFEPGLPSLSYLALRDADSLAVATFLSPERLGYPPGKAQRARLLGRIDALLATSDATAAAAAEGMRTGGDAFERTADALAALARRDRERYGQAVRAIVADFEARERHLTGVAIADTALVLQALAAERGLAAELASPVLPAL